jgi:DNA-binding NarL/FixJ family response regulator
VRRLLVIAEHPFVAEGIRLALRQTSGFRVIGFADGRREVGGRVTDAQPDVVLVDDMQQPEPAVCRVHEAAIAAPAAKILVLTRDMSPTWQRAVFGAGADALVSKDVHPVALGTLVRELADEHVAQRGGVDAAAADGDHGGCPLTPRELEILRLAAEGLTNAGIAEQLWVTEQTVKFHLSNTYRKLGVANRTQATRYAHVHDLLHAA